MVFAEMIYKKHYSDVHEELRSCLRRHFSIVQAGLQGDSWIWILDGEAKVAIDTCTSMKHQVKSPRPGAHVDAVIQALQADYRLRVYETPEREPHESA